MTRRTRNKPARTAADLLATADLGVVRFLEDLEQRGPGRADPRPARRDVIAVRPSREQKRLHRIVVLGERLPQSARPLIGEVERRVEKLIDKGLWSLAHRYLDPTISWAHLWVKDRLPYLQRLRFIVLAKQRHVEAAHRVFEAALQTARDVGDQRIAVRLEILRANVHIVSGELDDAEVRLDVALREARQLGDLELLGFAHHEYGYLSHQRARAGDEIVRTHLAAAAAHYAEALRLATRAERRKRVECDVGFLLTDVGLMGPAYAALQSAASSRRRVVRIPALMNLMNWALVAQDEGVFEANARVLAKMRLPVYLDASFHAQMAEHAIKRARPLEAARHLDQTTGLAVRGRLDGIFQDSLTLTQGRLPARPVAPDPLPVEFDALLELLPAAASTLGVLTQVVASTATGPSPTEPGHAEAWLIAIVGGAIATIAGTFAVDAIRDLLVWLRSWSASRRR